MKQQKKNALISPYPFLDALEANNDRAWCAEHRDEYDTLRAQWISQIQLLIDTMASTYAPELAGVEAKSCLYRIYRDIRFSNDKSPFKTYFSALVSPRGRHFDGACYYIHLGGGNFAENGLYGGVWHPESAVLRKLRKAIVDNSEEFHEIIDNPELKRLFPGWYGERLKTIPKGYDKNHPEAELLKLKEYGRYHHCDRAFFEDPEWPVRAARILAVLKPLNDFLNYSINEEE